ncbi:MAG TPA: DNA-binding protein, partial [Hyphomonas atlantica]|nr:DNA-binding protein [Hyphomonas atlantica]
LDLIAAFQKIEDHSLRKSLLATVQAAATAFEGKQQDED